MALLLLLATVLAGCSKTTENREYTDQPPVVNGPPCAAHQIAGTPETAPPPGTVPAALGTLPVGYEARVPAGPPRGVVILLHGGGWTDVGPGQVQAMRPEANRWLDRGWATIVVDYAACGQSLQDVIAAHDAVRNAIGPRAPIVLDGDSAGAQLALVLAARRPKSIAAVIAKSPPSDPTTILRQAPTDHQTRQPKSPVPAVLASTWYSAFGSQWKTTVPTRVAPRITARILLARSQADPIIGPGQLAELSRALADRPGHTWLRTLDLPAGEVPFVHASISPDAQVTMQAAIDQAVRPWSTRSPADLGVPSSVPGWWTYPPG
jgi:acetyl esterase/lipase